MGLLEAANMAVELQQGRIKSRDKLVDDLGSKIPMEEGEIDPTELADKGIGETLSTANATPQLQKRKLFDSYHQSQQN